MSRRSRWPSAAVLTAAGMLLLAGLLVTFITLPPPAPPHSPGPPPASENIPVSPLREFRPIGRGPRFRPSPRGVSGPCVPGRGGRFAIHLQLIAADRVIIVPAGIGVGRPWRLNEGRIAAGRCDGRFVTTDATGIVAISPGDRPTLGDLFAAWGQRLGSRRLLSFRGRVRVYLDGHPAHVAPTRLALWGHYGIVLEVGPSCHPAGPAPSRPARELERRRRRAYAGQVATVEVRQDELVVTLSRLERLAALRRSIRVPVSAVRSVCADPSPWSAVRGVRVGTGIPGVLSYGVRRMTGNRPDFTALHGSGPALRIECTPGAPYSRIIVSVADVPSAARRLSGLCAAHSRQTR